jgi:hypothetical protein
LHQNLLLNVVSPGFRDHTEFFKGRLTEERHATIVSSTMLPRPPHHRPTAAGTPPAEQASRAAASPIRPSSLPSNLTASNL